MRSLLPLFITQLTDIATMRLNRHSSGPKYILRIQDIPKQKLYWHPSINECHLLTAGLAITCFSFIVLFVHVGIQRKNNIYFNVFKKKNAFLINSDFTQNQAGKAKVCFLLKRFTLKNMWLLKIVNLQRITVSTKMGIRPVGSLWVSIGPKGPFERHKYPIEPWVSILGLESW